jgi:hypothetical protein
MKEAGEAFGFSPKQDETQGSITIKKDSVIINVKVKSSDNIYKPYFFNGKYKIMNP